MHFSHSKVLELLSALSVAAHTVSCGGKRCLCSIFSVLVIIFAQFGINTASAQETVLDTLDRTVHFRMGYRYVEPSYMNNKEALDNIISYIEENRETIESIEIVAWSSPDGKIRANNKLSGIRADSLAAYIVRNSNLSPACVQVSSGGIAWGRLRDLIAESSVDYRDEVVKIIDNIPLYVFDKYGKIIGGRKKILMDHEGGCTWKDMTERFFPELRSGLGIVVHRIVVPEPVAPSPEPALEPTLEPAPEPLPEPTPELVITPLPVIDSTLVEIRDTMTAEETPVEPVVTEPVDDYEIIPAKPLFALKTNLLYDLAATPNVELEVPIGKGRFSIMGEYTCPWWTTRNNANCWQAIHGGLEPRVWFGNREKKPLLTGHFIGVYGNIGKFDLELKSKGYQCDLFWSAGATYGYALPVNRSLRFEFSLSAGFFRAPYKYYEGVEDDTILAYQYPGIYSWFGPTKAKISFVWLIHSRERLVKKGGDR